MGQVKKKLENLQNVIIKFVGSMLLIYNLQSSSLTTWDFPIHLY